MRLACDVSVLKFRQHVARLGKQANFKQLMLNVLNVQVLPEFR